MHVRTVRLRYCRQLKGQRGVEMDLAFDGEVIQIAEVVQGRGQVSCAMMSRVQLLQSERTYF